MDLRSDGPYEDLKKAGIFDKWDKIVFEIMLRTDDLIGAQEAYEAYKGNTSFDHVDYNQCQQAVSRLYKSGKIFLIEKRNNIWDPLKKAKHAVFSIHPPENPKQGDFYAQGNESRENVSSPETAR